MPESLGVILLIMSRLRILLLSLGLFFGIASTVYAQMSPPEPMAQDNGRKGPPCDPGNGNGNGPGGNGNGNGVPPPVGLCLPIDGYVYILMGAGLVVGCYQFRKFDLT